MFKTYNFWLIWIVLNLFKFFGHKHSFNREKVYNIINNVQFEELLKIGEVGIVFIYGEWCDHSNTHKSNFIQFTNHLKKQGTKVKFFMLHINNIKELSIKIVDNPTLVMIKGHNKYELLKLNHNFDLMVNQVNYYRNLIKKILIKKVKKLKKFDKLVSLNLDTILLMTIDDTHKNYFHYLRLTDYKYQYQPYFVLSNSEEILNNFNFQKNSIYLYRKEDKKWIKYDKDTNFYLHNISNWLFVHSHPHVLQMENIGYEKIIHNENNAFILFMEDKEVNKSSNNRLIEDFEEAAEKIPESFIKTICYIGKPKCNKLIHEIDMNIENHSLPMLRILMENDSHYLIIYDDLKFINKENILGFYDNFMDGKTKLYLKEEKLNNNEDEHIFNLNTSNIDEFLNKNNIDRFVLYYRNEDSKYINFIKEIFEVLKEQNDLNINIGLYNIDKNTKFIVKDYEMPMIKLLKNGMDKKDKFWHFDNLKSQNDILYFILDNSTVDYSEFFKDHDF